MQRANLAERTAEACGVIGGSLAISFFFISAEPQRYLATGAGLVLVAASMVLGYLDRAKKHSDDLEN